MSLGFDVFRSSSSGAGDRIAGAAGHLGEALRDAGVTVSRRASEGARYARALGDNALTTGRDTARSTRALVEQRPLEALLVVGIAAFAIGCAASRAGSRFTQGSSAGTASHDARHDTQAHERLTDATQWSAGRSGRVRCVSASRRYLRRQSATPGIVSTP